MEKYSKWRDEKTSIHPFFAQKPKTARFVLSRFILGPLLFLVRLPLLIAVFLVYFIVAQVLELLPLPGALMRLPLRLVHMVGARLLLLIMGFWWVESRHSRSSRRVVLPTVTPGSHCSSGDLIVANLQGYAEVLYLAYRFAPVFTTVPIDGEGLVIKRSVFGALSDALHLERTYSKDDSRCRTATELLKKAEAGSRGPVVVFPEGTSSNGRGLLANSRALKGVEVRAERTHVVGFKYEWVTHSPAYTVGSAFASVYGVCSQVSNALTVRFLVPSEVPSHPSLDANRVGPAAGEGEWDEQVFQTLANALRMKRTALGMREKQEFLAYWRESHQKTYTKKHS